MKAISIRQPWAWMILHAGKDIENRTWPTWFRGRVLIHASKGMTNEEWDAAWQFARDIGVAPFGVTSILTFRKNIERGGIVGTVDIVDCVRNSESRWFQGPYGFVLRNPIIRQFSPCRGSLGFFDVPIETLS